MTAPVLPRAAEHLAPFVDAGVLAAADVHVAAALARLAGDTDPRTVLAAAMAVRAPRLGHVACHLPSLPETVTAAGDDPVPLADLPWPDPAGWMRHLTASPLVGAPPEPSADRPLVLAGHLLYLERHWRQEQDVARQLLTRAAAGGTATSLPATVLDDVDDPAQRAALELGTSGRLLVVAGGPGTGKTTTVGRLLAALLLSHPPGRTPAVALAAPTGKAAARMNEAVLAAAASLPAGARDALAAVPPATTIHRLLGAVPGAGFRRHRRNPLEHDVVVVDETSMISVSLMASLVEAVHPEALLVLVGDPDQLASVEAGAVLGDVVGPAARGPVPGPLAERIVVLHTSHRFGAATPLGGLAAAVRDGRADDAVVTLRSGGNDVTWVEVDDALASPDLAGLRPLLHDWACGLARAAAEGRAADAVGALEQLRVVCAHRRGPHGVAAWNERMAGWLAGSGGVDARRGWFPGQPILVTANDPRNGLANGDTGVVVRRDGDLLVAFGPARPPRLVPPARLAAVDTTFALTIHKSQGSEYEHVVVVLPPASSPLLTRELLYTAVTRARRRLTVVGTEEAVRGAVLRPVRRTSGLRGLLWGHDGS